MTGIALCVLVCVLPIVGIALVCVRVLGPWTALDVSAVDKSLALKFKERLSYAIKTSVGINIYIYIFFLIFRNTNYYNIIYTW